MADSKETPAEQKPSVDRAFLAANHPEIVAAIKAEGATAERERITAIQALHGPEDIKAACVQDAACSAGDAALKVNAAQKAADEERGKIHLKDRAAGEGKLDAPPPSVGPEATSDIQKVVARSRMLHESITGGSAPARA